MTQNSKKGVKVDFWMGDSPIPDSLYKPEGSEAMSRKTDQDPSKLLELEFVEGISAITCASSRGSLVDSHFQGPSYRIPERRPPTEIVRGKPTLSHEGKTVSVFETTIRVRGPQLRRGCYAYNISISRWFLTVFHLCV